MTLKHLVSSERLPQICSYACANGTNNQVHINAGFGTKVFMCSTNLVWETLINSVESRRQIIQWEDQRSFLSNNITKKKIIYTYINNYNTK